MKWIPYIQRQNIESAYILHISYLDLLTWTIYNDRPQMYADINPIDFSIFLQYSTKVNKRHLCVCHTNYSNDFTSLEPYKPHS